MTGLANHATYQPSRPISRTASLGGRVRHPATQVLLRHKDVTTRIIYPYVLNCGANGSEAV